jgi:hypothetical protein
MQQPAQGADDEDFDFAPDWRKVTFFRGVTDEKGKEIWNSTEYCLNGHEYVVCKENPTVEPPPVVVRMLRSE